MGRGEDSGFLCRDGECCGLEEGTSVLVWILCGGRCRRLTAGAETRRGYSLSCSGEAAPAIRARSEAQAAQMPRALLTKTLKLGFQTHPKCQKLGQEKTNKTSYLKNQPGSWPLLSEC